MDVKPVLSIVVPAYNEEKTIGRTLKALSEQRTETPFEVIVVNNNSIDNTVEEASKYKGKLNLRIVTETTQGIGPTKARGGQEAKGEFVAVIDADTIAHPRWIDTALKYFEDPKVAGVTGPWRMTGLPKFRAWILNTIQKVAMIPFRIFFGDWSLNGMNMVIRKSAYDKVGGLDKTLSSHEDLELAMRLRKVGKIVYADDLWVNTSGRRYKYGIIRGVLEYESAAFKVFFLKRKKTELEKIR